MRQLMIAGIVVLGLGAFVLIRGGSFTSRHDVLEVGDVKVTADEQQTIPPWVGWVGVLAGGAMIVSGMQKRA